MRPPLFRVVHAALWGSVLWMATPPARAACGDGLSAATRQDIRAQDAVLVFAPLPGPITVGKHFSLDVRLCSATGAAAAKTKLRLLKVDADMPAHRHGMNYLATVRSTGAGAYRADGLMFHMPGVWRLSFDVDGGAGTVAHRLTHELLLE
jgi:hypothetical protein